MREVYEIRIGKVRGWNPEDVRCYCVRHNYYTRGDCRAYDEMLNFVSQTIPTTENLYKVAIDILEHSDRDRFPRPEDIMSLMDDLEVSVVTTSYFYMD